MRENTNKNIALVCCIALELIICAVLAIIALSTKPAFEVVKDYIVTDHSVNKNTYFVTMKEKK